VTAAERWLALYEAERLLVEVWLTCRRRAKAMDGLELVGQEIFIETMWRVRAEFMRN
jgi:hypothetical protein